MGTVRETAKHRVKQHYYGILNTHEYFEHNLEAVYLAKEINLTNIVSKLDKNLISKKRESLAYLLSQNEFLFIFSFGAVVFVNVSKDMQGAIKHSLGRFMSDTVKKNYNETYILRESERKIKIGENSADLTLIGMGEMEITARILAQSVALEYIEDLTDEILNNIETINNGLEKEGRFFRNTKSILKLFGQNNNIIQFVISKLSLLDKPEVTWENERLEVLFSQLADNFDLRPRFKNIEYKIGFARDNSEFALTALQGIRANFLEVIIIFLFIFDILTYIVK